jgi:hypothetical protein
MPRPFTVEWPRRPARPANLRDSPLSALTLDELGDVGAFGTLVIETLRAQAVVSASAGAWRAASSPNNIGIVSGAARHGRLRVNVSRRIIFAVAAHIQARGSEIRVLLIIAHQTALLLISSGTTGAPKVIPRTHRDYLYGTRNSMELVVDFDSVVVGVGVQFGRDARTGAGRGRGDAVHDDFVAGRGRPRQFVVIAENSGCSFLFHFDVPGDMARTVAVRPVSTANVAGSVFRARWR